VCVFCWKTADLSCLNNLNAALVEWHSETWFRRRRDMHKLKAAILIFILSIVGSSAFAKGAPVFFSWGGESFYKVADLPDTYEYKFNSDFVDIGVKYSEIQIFFLPVWQYDMKYVAIIPNNSDSYYDLNNEEVMDLAKSASISIPPISEVKLDFWTAWGGKLVLALLIGLFVMYSKYEGRKEEADG